MIKKCKFFILSVYSGWVFGTFTDGVCCNFLTLYYHLSNILSLNLGWTKAIVSHIVKRSDASPNLMQWTVYWIASSMQLEGTYSRTVSLFSCHLHVSIFIYTFQVRHLENTDFHDPYKVTEVFKLTPKPRDAEEWLARLGSKWRMPLSINSD